MTRILLTGAGGFFGHHFLEHVLSSTDWDVTATDSFRHKGTTDRIAQVLDSHPEWRSRVTIITHDLTAPFSPVSVVRLGNEDGIDFIIAAASESHVERSISDPVPFALNNTAVMLSTLELARHLRPRAVMVISTDEVYGPAAPGEAHAEWSPVIPSNVYAASKASQEALAIAYWRTYGVPAVIVNSMNMFGERQDPEKFIPKVLRTVLAGGEVSVHGVPGDIGTRHWLHCRNLADGILFLLSGPPPAAFGAHAAPGAPQGSRPDRYNIASADRISNLALAQMIAAAAGKPLRYRLEDFHSARPGHDPHYALDSGKMAVLGWKPPIPLAESLERTVRWTMAHPDWI